MCRLTNVILVLPSTNPCLSLQAGLFCHIQNPPLSNITFFTCLQTILPPLQLSHIPSAHLPPPSTSLRFPFSLSISPSHPNPTRPAIATLDWTSALWSFWRRRAADLVSSLRAAMWRAGRRTLPFVSCSKRRETTWLWPCCRAMARGVKPSCRGDAKVNLGCLCASVCVFLCVCVCVCEIGRAHV